MMKKLVVMLLFASAAAMAEAQVPVETDPFHTTIFENDRVRVLDLSVSGKDTTTTHVHQMASVVVFLSTSVLAIQSPGTAPAITTVKVGDVIYRPYDEKPAVHKVWSADGSLMRCLVIEIKEKR